MKIIPSRCDVCVAPFYCELNGKCQKGLDREQKGNGSDGSVGMFAMQTLGIRGNPKSLTSHPTIRNEAK